MKYAEYKEKIDGLLTNPDTALAGIDEVYESLEADLTTRDSLADENETLKNKVKELQETNIKLYMSQGGDNTEETDGKEDEAVDEDIKAVDDFFDELFEEEKED